MPLINSGSFTIKSLTIESGATFTQTGGQLLISGANSSITGSLYLSAGTMLSANSFTVENNGLISVSGSGTIHMANAIGSNPSDNIIIEAGGVINQSGGTIYLKDFTTKSGTPVGSYVQTGGTFRVFHDFKNSGTFNASGGTIQFSGDAGGGSFPANVTSSNTQFFHVLVDAGVNPKFGTNAVNSFAVAGNWTNNSADVDLDNKANTTIFNGTGAQVLGGIATTIFRNVVVDKPSGDLTLALNQSINSGDLTVSSGTLDLGTYTFNRVSAGGSINVENGAELKIGSNSGGQAGSNFPFNFSSISCGSTSTVEYYGTNAITQTVFGGATYGDLVLTNSSGSGTATKITSGNITVNGTVNINDNVLFSPGAAYTVGGTGSLTGNGTIQVTRTSATPDLVSQYTISNKDLTALTVDYNASSAQTINALDYYNLKISGSRGSNNVTLASSGTISISGSFTVPATFSSGNYVVTGSTVHFNSGSSQDIPAFTFNNLSVSGGAKIATGVINVNTGLTLNSTTLTTTASNLLTILDNATVSGASFTAYVNGPVKKTGNDAFTFPVGKTGTGYMPIGISAPSSVTDAFTAEYKRSSATSLGSVTAPGLVRVSNCDYWDLDRVNGSSSVNVTLSWNGFTNCNIAAYINDLSSLTVAHFNGTSWDTHGSAGYTGSASSGTITRNGVSVFSPFSLGSTDDFSNPLSVKFSSVTAALQNAGARISWTNESEMEINHYIIERSGNGSNFIAEGQVAASKNSGTDASYQWLDARPLTGVSFYRIKAVANNGGFAYSKIVKVEAVARPHIQVYPNPVISNNVYLKSPGLKQGTYQLRIFDIRGKQIFQSVISHPGGPVVKAISLPAALLPGIYSMNISGNELNLKLSFIRK